jgi:hypothetical protein
LLALGQCGFGHVPQGYFLLKAIFSNKDCHMTDDKQSQDQSDQFDEFEALSAQMAESIAYDDGRLTLNGIALTTLDELERLADLYERGAITDVEFEKAKKEMQL